jgi:hypothetical protein
VTADDNLLGLLTAEVKDATLILGAENGKSIAGKMPVYKITVAKRPMRSEALPAWQQPPPAPARPQGVA